MSNEKVGSSDIYSRIAIISGSCSGIGEATAKRLVAGSYGVVGNARNTEAPNT
jgi:NADP-dependent 3-hydroxy acid dehydrogenase YdfG